MVAGYNAKIAELEQEGREKTQWAHRDLNAEIRRLADVLGETDAALEQTAKELQERTALGPKRWRMSGANSTTSSNMVRASRWVKLGRKVGIGPAL